MHLNVISYTIL